jgi:SNF2 family DNA or RNA helicase
LHQEFHEEKRGERAEASTPKDRIALIIKDNIEVVEFKRTPRTSGVQKMTLPSGLVSTLFQYQRDGVNWLQEHWVQGSPGALLADDMGLGKTLQALAFLVWIREMSGAEGRRSKPSLVVAPTGLLKNWIDEHNIHLKPPGLGRRIEAFGPGLASLRNRDASRGDELKGGYPVLEISRLEKADWVLTTYETLRNYQHSFGRVHWRVMVLDEAQKIKNPAALMTDAVKAMNADFTLAMTGTPVENRYADLWSILDTALPGLLGSLKEFSAKFDTYDPDEVTPEIKGEELRGYLDSRITPQAMKRRLKSEHLRGLPDIEHLDERVEMPPVQAVEYGNVVRQGRERKRGEFLVTLAALRSIALHPCPGDLSLSDDDYVNASARMTFAFKVLDEIATRNEKALVFLESREVQGRLAEIIQRRYELDHKILLINGSVAGSDRKRRVDIFQERPGFDVMILSPKAGGVGLTLTAANHVVHLSRWWNPAVEDQSTDRVYRIGQKRKVRVYYPLAVHPEYAERSFDITLNGLLERKRSMSRSALAPTLSSKNDLEDLFKETVMGGD